MPRYSPLASPTETRAFLDARNLFPKKQFGQNFLIDDTVIGRILALSEANENDIILEVGPGIGVLTLGLLESGAKLIAVELDSALAAELPRTVALFEDDATLEANLTVIEGDATKITPADLPMQPTKLVANLPYNVAATTVLHLFEVLPSLESATVMVQTEVANRMAAKPGVKDYGAYTIKLSCYARPAGSFVVQPSSFMPAPRVSSTVLRLEREDVGESREFLAQTATVIDAAFAQRRKTIRNSMSATAFPNKEALDEAFASAGFDSSRRAETFSREEFFALTRALEGSR